MKDFLGQEFGIGDYLVYPNYDDYGLLMVKVIGFTPKGVSVLRLDTDYRKKLNYLKRISITNHNKLCKITPPSFAIAIFERLEHSAGMSEQIDIDPRLGGWTHGNDKFSW